MDQKKRPVSGDQSHINGKKQNYTLAHFVLFLVRKLMRLRPLARFLKAKALHLQTTEHAVISSYLPKSFHQFKILHLTDFHIDCNPSVIDELVKTIRPLVYDLVLLTGDYQDDYHLNPIKIKSYIEKLIDTIPNGVPVVATLGNHDNNATIRVLESLGIKVLINESYEIHRGKDSIVILGIDDVHWYFSDSAISAFETINPEPFTIVAVHSPEAFEIAEKQGAHVYLCGHTHGGQICFRAGQAVLTHADCPKHMASGSWNFGRLIGYTNRGVGTSGIPLRWNCPGEVLLARLVQE